MGTSRSITKWSWWGALMVVFDATMMLLVLWPDAPAPLDPLTNAQVDKHKERIDFLFQNLEKNKTKIIIPTPALSEVLVKAGRNGSHYVSRIEKSGVFRIEPFDTRSAIEVSIMTRNALDQGDKRAGGDGVWAKIKYDRQIVAISKVVGATAIYSDDKNIRAFGGAIGLNVIGLGQCPLPPQKEEPPLLERLPEGSRGRGGKLEDQPV